MCFLAGPQDASKRAHRTREGRVGAVARQAKASRQNARRRARPEPFGATLTKMTHHRRPSQGPPLRLAASKHVRAKGRPRALPRAPDTNQKRPEKAPAAPRDTSKAPIALAGDIAPKCMGVRTCCSRCLGRERPNTDNVYPTQFNRASVATPTP